MEYTKGGWINRQTRVESIDGEIIAQCWGVDHFLSTQEAINNARLIAAAPDMYEALKELTSRVSIMGYFKPSKQAQFRQALAKANGE